MTELSLRDVDLFRIPGDCLRTAMRHLRQRGDLGLEGFALWAGTLNGREANVTTTIVPRQTGYSSERGVCVVIDGAELHRINVWMYEQRVRLLAQVHSHPTEAYHSETDDSFPIVTTDGGLSLVVPDFARGPFDLQTAAVHRLLGRSGWVRLATDAAAGVMRIE